MSKCSQNSRFKVGDYITYEKTIGIQLAIITSIDNYGFHAKVIEKTNWKLNVVRTGSTREDGHVWKGKYMLSPLWKKLEGIK